MYRCKVSMTQSFNVDVDNYDKARDLVFSFVYAGEPKTKVKPLSEEPWIVRIDCWEVE